MTKKDLTVTGKTSSTPIRILKTATLVIGGLALLVGCHSEPMQRAQDRMDNFKRDWVSRLRPSQENVESVMVDPMPDKATELRGWDKSTFVYPSGVTLAYPTYGLNYEDRPRWLSNDYVMSLVTPGILIYDVLAMPVYMAMEGPTTPVEYHGARQPASMTLEPPLPQTTGANGGSSGYVK